MSLFDDPLFTYVAGLFIGAMIAVNAPDDQPEIKIVKECYKQTTDSKTMLHRIKCEVE